MDVETDAVQGLLDLQGSVPTVATAELPDYHELLHLLALSNEENLRLQARVQEQDQLIEIMMHSNKQQGECIKSLTVKVLTYDSIKHDDDLVNFYTGLPDRKTFDALFG